MLMLSRKVGESIVIDNKTTVTIQRISGDKVKIGLEAPPNVPIRRGELEPLPPPGPPVPTPAPAA